MELKKKVKFHQVKYQYLTVFGGAFKFRNIFKFIFQAEILLANLISFCYGLAVGWLSSAVPILKSQKTTLQSGPLTLEQTMWLGGVFPLGGLVSNCIFGLLGNHFGRITALSFLAFPNIVNQ